MKSSKTIKKVFAEVKKACLSTAFCNKCPYWDDDLKCRIGYPVNWYINDWEEYKDENA